MKKASSLHHVIVVLALGISFCPTAGAQGACLSLLSEDHSTSSSDRIERQALEKLRNIWPEASERQLTQAAREFARSAARGFNERSESLRVQDRQLDPRWALKAVEYAFYVNQFGVPNETGNFDTARELLPYLKSLGVTVVYAFPFLRSPRKDAGFDVSDFMQVDERYGGNKAFFRFVAAAKKLGMKVKMDLILNHISDEHPWFRAFLNGDMTYRDYFHVLDHPPEIVSKVSDHRGRVITYRERNLRGEEVLIERRVIFPDISDTHYREVEVPIAGGKKKFWVYYTFYPFQIDLNYDNPKMYSEIYRIVNFWANNGVDIFRLDAVPFLNKSGESHAQTHEIVQLLNSYLRQISPGTLLMPEACQPAQVIADYFGHSTRVSNEFQGQDVATTTEAQIVYDFEGMQNWWPALISGEKKYAVESDLKTPKAPANGLYARFLRIHDELTQEMTSPAARREVLKLDEQRRGVAFREGLGVAGRMSDFLGRDPDRILMAYALMMGKKGMPILYFGDEIMVGNNLKYAEDEAKHREEFFRANGIQAKSSYDARDINRGPIPKSRFLNLDPDSQEAKVWRGLQAMIKARMSDPALVYGEETPVATDSPHVYAWERATPDGDVTLIVLNLSGQEQVVRIGGHALQLYDLISGGLIETISIGQDLNLNLPPYAHLWLKRKFASQGREFKN